MRKLSSIQITISDEIYCFVHIMKVDIARRTYIDILNAKKNLLYDFFFSLAHRETKAHSY